LLSVEEEILKALVDGVKFSDVYNTAETFVKNNKPALLEKMTKTLGYELSIILSVL